jgi:hypothetical protein
MARWQTFPSEAKPEGEAPNDNWQLGIRCGAHTALAGVAAPVLATVALYCPSAAANGHYRNSNS